MPENFITKRQHKKSRAGCATCKSRKIKCDEVTPTCTFCAARKIQCHYLSKSLRSAQASSPDSQCLVVAKITPSSTASPLDDIEDSVLLSTSDPISFLAPVAPLPWSMSTTDLRVMHHWSTFTWNTIGVGRPEMDKVMQVDLPVLAFESKYLLNGVLGLASLHMQTLLPDSSAARKQTAIYRARAFSEFREALAKMEPMNTNAFGSALLMTITLVVLCSQDSEDEDGLTVVNWVLLYQGLAAVIMMRSYEEVDATKAAPILIRQLNEIQIPLVIPQVLIDMVAAIDFTDPDFEGIEHYCNALDCIATLLASVLQDGMGPALYTRLVSWPSRLGATFAVFAKEKRPRALVVLAWYLAFLKLLDNLWWIKGMPDRDIRLISNMLGPQWAPYLEIPLQVTKATNHLEVLRILL